MGDAARPRPEQPDADLAPATELDTPVAPVAAEPVAIPAYGCPRPPRGEVPGWLRYLMALPVYFVVLWLVVIPGYPLPVLPKAALGFLVAGGAAGLVVRRRGWLAGLLGFALVLALALATLVVTLGVDVLGPSFLLNADTAHGDTAAVGKVQDDLLHELPRLAAGAGLLSMLGGAIGSRLRRRTAI